MTHGNDVLVLIGGLALVVHALHTLLRELVRDLRQGESPIVPVPATPARWSLAKDDGHVCGCIDACDRTDVLPEPSAVRAGHVDLPADVMRFC